MKYFSFLNHLSYFLDLKDKMDQLVGEINGRFSTPRWSPIRYIFGCINQVSAVNFFVIWLQTLILYLESLSVFYSGLHISFILLAFFNLIKRFVMILLPKQNELAGYYRDADVALVTPMRDGMNLVAKEFVACKGTFQLLSFCIIDFVQQNCLDILILS